MNGGTFLKVLLLLGLVAGGGYMVVQHNIEKAKRALAEDQDVLKGFQRSLGDRARELESVNSRTASALEKVVQHETLTKKKAELTQTLSDVNDEQKKMIQEFAGVIQRVRSGSVGMELAELKLPTGAVLKNAKIEKVNESELLVSHAGGVSRLMAKDVPSDLMARFRFGDPVMTGGVPAVPASAARPAPSPAPVPKTSSSSPAAGATPSKAVAEKQMYELKTKVATLQTQIKAAEKQSDEYKREAAVYMSKHNVNRSTTTAVDYNTGTLVSASGGRTDTYNITAKEYEKKSADLEARITIAKTQVAAMQVEIERLQAIVNR